MIYNGSVLRVKYTDIELTWANESVDGVWGASQPYQFICLFYKSSEILWDSAKKPTNQALLGKACTSADIYIV